MFFKGLPRSVSALRKVAYGPAAPPAPEGYLGDDAPCSRARRRRLYKVLGTTSPPYRAAAVPGRPRRSPFRQPSLRRAMMNPQRLPPLVAAFKAAEIFIFSQMHQSLRSLPRRRGSSYPAEDRPFADCPMKNSSLFLTFFWAVFPAFSITGVAAQKLRDGLLASGFGRKLRQNLKPQLHLVFSRARRPGYNPSASPSAGSILYRHPSAQAAFQAKPSPCRSRTLCCGRRRARETAAVVEAEPAARGLAREEYPAPAELVDIRAVVRRVARRCSMTARPGISSPSARAYSPPEPAAARRKRRRDCRARCGFPRSASTGLRDADGPSRARAASYPGNAG